MKTSQKKSKIIAIVGPTASGKSELSVRLAKKFNGEVVSVDSRQVYRGLDIGSGKITRKEMRGVSHHLLDIANPRQTFTTSQFAKKGVRAIAGILKRGKVPILAGGTGFYLSVLLGEISLPNVPPNKKLRVQLTGISSEKLFKRLKRLDPKRARTIDRHNRVRLIRAIEIALALGKVPHTKRKPLYQTLKIGINMKESALRRNIRARLVSRLRKGMLAEGKHLHRGGLSWKRMDALGLEYRSMARYLKKEITREEMEREMMNKIWQYAKRQRTWFKRDKAIKWFTPQERSQVGKEVRKFLS